MCTQTLQGTEEAMQKNKDNTHPWVLCVGSPTSISSAVLVCQKKVVSKDIGKTVFSSILVLMAANYAYEFAYNPMTQQVLEFLQEKLLGDPLQASRKTSASYSNLFRAIDCIEKKIEEEEVDGQGEVDEDETQMQCEFN